MQKIKYNHSTTSKKVFLTMLILLILSRFIVFFQAISYNINNYNESYNVGATIALYVFYFLIGLFFLFGHKLFYISYNHDTIAYHNFILKSKKEISFDNISKVILGKRGMNFYKNNDDNAVFFIPFFRLGLISIIDIDNFYKFLKSKNINIEKQFIIMPGYGKSRKFIKTLYSGLSLFVLAYLTQSIALIFAIFKSH